VRLAAAISCKTAALYNLLLRRLLRSCGSSLHCSPRMYCRWLPLLFELLPPLPLLLLTCFRG
jgi:hypothetical protein